MKTLIVLLAMAFSVNSFAHGGIYLNPSQQTTLAPFFGTTMISVSFEGTTASVSGHMKRVVADSQEFRLTGVASAALEESIRNIQSENDVSDAEAVDMLTEMAEGILAELM